jgi:hypothetical protein
MGWQKKDRRYQASRTTCPRCNGKGTGCRRCGGKGNVSKASIRYGSRAHQTARWAALLEASPETHANLTAMNSGSIGAMQRATWLINTLYDTELTTEQAVAQIIEGT